MPKNTTPRVELDELLASEYEYITHTASQANEDRARVASFYLIAVGSLVAALFGTQLFDTEKYTQTVKIMFSGLFVLLTLLGTSTVMQLARLRAAWYEAMLAMNQIKDFAMNQSPELTAAFRWTKDTLPPKYKRGSVSYFQAVEVSLISGLMFGAAMFFLQQAFYSITWVNWVFSGLSGLFTIYIQLVIYRRVLN
ncbi:MAG: hypothetical protein L0287_33555 [Anaerolineae bacterium]|nr:hypothetical protein [Anaerolineae bacterium]MCI0611043.1 hypothetical protein [Anaerolineae bacterium]